MLRLDVDTSTAADGKLPVNVDIYFPSLPCAELVTDVVDESGSQQLAVTDTLHKLRVDRNGVSARSRLRLARPPRSRPQSCRTGPD